MGENRYNYHIFEKYPNFLQEDEERQWFLLRKVEAKMKKQELESGFQLLGKLPVDYNSTKNWEKLIILEKLVGEEEFHDKTIGSSIYYCQTSACFEGTVL